MNIAQQPSPAVDASGEGNNVVVYERIGRTKLKGRQEVCEDNVSRPGSPTRERLTQYQDTQSSRTDAGRRECREILYTRQYPDPTNVRTSKSCRERGS